MNHHLCHKCGSLLALVCLKDEVILACESWPECDVQQPIDRYGQPRGPQTDKEIRFLRVKAHGIFDQLWTSGLMTRDAAYEWLAEQMGISVSDAHIGMMGVDDLNRVKGLSLNKFRRLNMTRTKKSRVDTLSDS